jgi:tetratricopeptide (TPR) repeat protein
MAVGPISSGVFSPDGKWYAGGGNYSAWILRVGSWEQQPARRWVGGVAFSPDSRILAVESGAGAIYLLDPATGREKARLDDPNQDVADSLVFTPDGTRLVAVSNDGQAVHVWDLRLIREELAELGLDWDEPPYPPAAPAQPAETLRVTVVGDELTYNPGPMLAWEAQECSLQLLRNPLDARLYSQRGRVFAQFSDTMKALADLNFALALQPDDPGARFLRGKLHQQRREWQAAIDDYTFLLQRQPADPQVRGLRGVCREALGDDVEAARDLGEWIKYGDENAVLLNNLAWRLIRYSKESKNAELALPLIEQANRQWPNRYSLVHTLGVNYYRLSRYSEALSTLERAGKLDSAGPTAAVQYFQAMCRFKLDDPAGAQRDFDLAVRWHENAKLTPPLAEEMQSFRAEAEAMLKKLPE